MRHVIVSGKWLFNNMSGYGFEEWGRILLSPDRSGSDVRVFVPLLRVEGAELFATPCFFTGDKRMIHNYVCFSEEEMKEKVCEEDREYVYQATTYPPLLYPQRFHVIKKEEEFVAVPKQEKADLSCLLLFGGDKWVRVNKEITTGTVLLTAHSKKDFFGIVVLKPGQTVSILQLGWNHEFTTYSWDGNEISVSYATPA